MKLNEQARIQIQQDTAAFLKSGGKVKKIEGFVYQPLPTVSKHKPKFEAPKIAKNAPIRKRMDAIRDAVLSAYAAGGTVGTIAYALETTRPVVSRILDEAGVERRAPTSWTASKL